MDTTAHAPAVAVLIPCFNEGKTIATVVSEFKRELPHADIYVYDNNSTDNTVAEAQQAGAIVRLERRQGKGNVVQTMFSEINADVFVLVDGDSTYPADKVSKLIAPILDGSADMTIGSRLLPSATSTFRLTNRIGNMIFIFIVNTLFKVAISDLLSGYRAFSREVVKQVPITSQGFDLETELTVAALERNYRIVEIPTALSSRPEGSTSKIRIWKDGFLILNTILALFRDYKPLAAFGAVGLFFIICGLIPGAVVIAEFLSTGLISRIPSAILAVGLVLTGLIICFAGLVLHSIARRFQILDKQLRNLSMQK